MIELLVVVAIIALLVAILVPALSEARDLAKAAVCSSNLKQQYLGVVYYAIANHDWVVPVWSWETARKWEQSIASAAPGILGYIDYTDLSTRSSVFLCPSEKTTTWAGSAQSWNWHHYAINHDATGQIEIVGGRWDWAPPVGGRKLSSYRNPARIMLIMDSEWYWAQWRAVANFYDSYGMRQVRFRHVGEKVNTVYADGHVGQIGKKEMIWKADYPWIDPREIDPAWQDLEFVPAYVLD